MPVRARYRDEFDESDSEFGDEANFSFSHRHRPRSQSRHHYERRQFLGPEIPMGGHYRSTSMGGGPRQDPYNINIYNEQAQRSDNHPQNTQRSHRVQQRFAEYPAVDYEEIDRVPSAPPRRGRTSFAESPTMRDPELMMGQRILEQNDRRQDLDLRDHQHEIDRLNRNLASLRDSRRMTQESNVYTSSGPWNQHQQTMEEHERRIEDRLRELRDLQRRENRRVSDEEERRAAERAAERAAKLSLYDRAEMEREAAEKYQLQKYKLSHEEEEHMRRAKDWYRHQKQEEDDRAADLDRKIARREQELKLKELERLKEEAAQKAFFEQQAQANRMKEEIDAAARKAEFEKQLELEKAAADKKEAKAKATRDQIMAEFQNENTKKQVEESKKQEAEKAIRDAAIEAHKHQLAAEEKKKADEAKEKEELKKAAIEEHRLQLIAEAKKKEDEEKAQKEMKEAAVKEHEMAQAAEKEKKEKEAKEKEEANKAAVLAHEAHLAAEAAKKAKEDEEEQKKLRERLQKLGYDDKYIDALLKPNDGKEEAPQKQLGGAETWIKVHRQFLGPETLNHFGLPWGYDPEDPGNYFVIKTYISETQQEELFAHAARLRQGGSGGAIAHSSHHTTTKVKVNDRKRDKLFLVRKKAPKSGTYMEESYYRGRY